ncbi:helix-turn-helix domain-containing protein [Phreatobacter stygius]|uniref:AraC family transcriptional regulator n=1 Tax=Phreatobacter stygius TaxID=1940610 RepID=A0A4D7BBK1_9HYPH|nr:helix-turn-helix domain-containing protein [Phreatobacter stygius]QCI68033.1 AraC family transcriptional regulator [Phreatobacter stygius]
MRQTLDRTVIGHDQSPPRGLLNKARSLQKFELVRLAPSEDLAAYIEHFWLVLWDLRGAGPYTQENLPHPTQHLVVDPVGGTGIFGLQRAKFTYTLKDAGAVIGTKFRPGLFRGFLGRSMDTITDKAVPIGEVFDVSDATLDQRFAALADPAGMADEVETLLRRRMPAPDARALEVSAQVALIAETRDLCSVSALARRSGVSARTLQRQFESYVGVGPKWVIDRYRMIEAVEALNRNEELSLTALAHALGYFDQAHFSKAFLALTGKTPSHYRRQAAPAGP